MDHSREQLIYILSSIAKTLGQVVRSSSWREDYMDGGHMEPQVLVTTPVRMTKVPPREAMELINPDVVRRNDLENPLDDIEDKFGGNPYLNPRPQPALRQEDEQGDEDPQDPQEDIRRIARTIDEDLI